MNSSNLSKIAQRRFAVVGYSTRALAEAVAELGCEVIAVDHFCDSDTSKTAKCIAIGDWPNGIVEAVAELTVDGILLAGGMENLPQVIKKFSGSGKLPGMSHQTLAKLRDVKFLRTAAEAAEIRFPEVIDALQANHERKDWLWKPLLGAGGRGIRSALPFTEKLPATSGYFQRLVRGRSIGVSCIAANRQSRVIGATQSLANDESLGPQPFVYRGSIGPISLTSQQTSSVVKLCDYLSSQTSVSGWIQFDFIEAEDEQLWLLECNPRWTAGMEILRISGMANMALLHLEASLFGSNQSPVAEPRAWDRWAGKAIFYAERKTLFGHESKNELTSALQTWSAQRSHQESRAFELDIADIPAGEQVFKVGQPVLTMRLQIDRHANDIEQTANQLLIQSLQEGQRIVRQFLSR